MTVSFRTVCLVKERGPIWSRCAWEYRAQRNGWRGF